jgi:hypothetical protein
MVAEVLRELAVLVSVFYMLDVFLDERSVTLSFTIVVLVGCILALSLGIVLERVRAEE